jgi:hypothetical protein
MKHEPLELLAFKAPVALADELRRRAREDDRTVSAYLRRLVAAVVEVRTDDRDTTDPTR